MVEIGIKGTSNLVVTDDLTAAKVGSGGLPVFATPEMITLMEKTCFESVESSLDEGQTTVGVYLETHHVSATPIGMEVTCESVVTAVDGRKLKFSVKAYDGGGLIGDATHERVIVDKTRFMEKAESKQKK